MADDDAPDEKLRRTMNIRDAYMRPALQRALGDAVKDGQDKQEALNALMTAYQEMLISVLNPEAAASMLESQARFVRERVIPAVEKAKADKAAADAKA